MSFVSGVVLCTSCIEDEVSEDGPVVLFEKINEWLAAKRPFKLNRVENSFGGSKHPQMFVAGGGFNYFPEDEFAAFVLSLPWLSPENVVLVIEPDQGVTRVFRPSEQTSSEIDQAREQLKNAEVCISVRVAEIERLRSSLEKIAHIAGEFSPEHADPATALLACEQEALRAISGDAER